MNNDTFSEEDSVAFEEPLMSQVVQQEALTKLLIEKEDIHQRWVFRDGEDRINLVTGKEKFYVFFSILSPLWFFSNHC